MSAYASASLEQILVAIRAQMPTLRAMGVVRAGVFGSRARGTSRPDSDLDLLVEFEPRQEQRLRDMREACPS